ncbi:MAG: HNH endonuclease [Peptococcaceae bacterium]|nr:HNH endonuclease [Peptococcaceae bacterium]
MASQKNVDQAWEKAIPIPGENPDVWRKDSYGNTIRRSSYRTQGDYGWELDHKKPQAKGGSNSSRNIQPLHWRENREKSDKYRHK